MFLLLESAGRRRASLHWVLRASSPASTVLSSATTSCRPSRRPLTTNTVFPLLGGTSVALVVMLLDGRVHRRGLELVTRFLRPGIAEETTGSPKSSWGISMVRLHMFQSDAGRTAYTRPYRCSNVALGFSNAKAPTKGLSTPGSMAFELVAGTVPNAWSASQCRLLIHHARLASSCWSGSTGQAFHPQGSDERFQICKLHLVPLSQALLGANDVAPGTKRDFANCRSCGRECSPATPSESRDETSVSAKPIQGTRSLYRFDGARGTNSDETCESN